MATTVATTQPPPPPPQPPPSSCVLNVESLTHIDVRKLSQSELHALSLCSNSAFDLHRTDEVVAPQIDRSLFNESAGSRRQTYSRLRLRHPHHRTTRLPGLLPNPKPKPSPSIDPESHAILHFLKHFLNHGLNSTPPPPPPPPLPPPQPEVVSITPQQYELGLGIGFEEKMPIGKKSIDKKRKRDRKGKGNMRLMENGVGIELQVMNKKGEPVDFAVLESNGDNLYSEELKRRTVGLESEEAVLGFMTSLGGQWCSRRKKRKYVDASEFGDVLPIGWKLLLSLKRRDSRSSVYCRRYISPFGQQFISCKEAASFLRSHFVHYDAEQPMDQRASSSQPVYHLASESNAGISHKPAHVQLGIVPYSTFSASTTSDLHGSEVSLVGIENLSEVQVQDLFECYKCNLSFDEKNAYLQHLFSFHQQTTKRVKFGRPVGEGVIIRDGKYECQFCHKVFEERRKYNGHVGVHVRNYRGPEELGVPVAENKSIESLIQQGLALSSSAIDVSIENAGNATLETSTAGLADRSTGSSCPSIMSYSKAATPATHQQLNLGSDLSEMPTEDCKVEGALAQELNQHDLKDRVGNGVTTDVDNTQNIEVNTDAKSNNNCLAVAEVEKYENSGQKVNFASRDDTANNDTIVDTTGLIVEANVLQNDVASSSELFMQSLDYFPAFAAASDKGVNEFLVVDQKLQNVTGFEELRLDGIEPFRYSFAEVQGSPSLPGSSFDLANGAGMEEGLNSSVRFNSEEAILNMEGGDQLTTLCVWCRSEFKLEAVDSETQSDTIGYMCPTCKDKISGHLDSGYP